MVSGFIKRSYNFIRKHHRLIAVGLWLVMLFGLALDIWLDIRADVEQPVVRAYLSDASTSTDGTPTTLTIDARLTLADHAIQGAPLVAVLYGKNGSQANVPLPPTNATGKSKMDVPASLGNDTVSRIVVRAHVRSDMLDDVHRALVPELMDKKWKAKDLQTQTSFLVVSGGSRAAPAHPKTEWWLPVGIGIVFVTTLMFAPWMNLGTARVLTLVHCSVMLIAFTYAYRYVIATVDPGQILQLSFGYICWGSYLTMPSTWTFVVGTSDPSLTAESTSLSLTTIGAPLWVMLLSVLGSTLLVVSLLIDLNTKAEGQAKSEAQGQAKSEAQANIHLLIRHQFYILFSPVGAVFVYQALVELKLLDRNLLVAAMSLVAGTTINLILDFGIRRVHALFSRDDTADSESEVSTDHSKTARKPEVGPDTTTSPLELLASSHPSSSQDRHDSSAPSPDETPRQTIEM